MSLLNLVSPSEREAGTSRTPDFQEEFRKRVRWAWRVLWRGKFLVLAIRLAALVPTVRYLQQITPRYTAETRIMIEASQVRNALADTMIRPEWINDVTVQTEADLISSRMLAHRVVEKLGLANDPEFNPKLRPPRPLDSFLSSLNPLSWLAGSLPSNEADPSTLSESSRAEIEQAALVQRFLGGLQVAPQRRTLIIAVRYTSENREKAALIANTIAQLYVLDRLEAGFEDTRRVATWLGERLESLRRDVVSAESAVEEYRAQHGLRRKGDQQATINEQRLSELNSRLMIARADLAQKRARLDQARQLMRSRGSVDAFSDVLQSPLIQRLREQEATTQREMSDALKVYADRHPRILGLRAELNEIRGKIAHEVDKIGTSLSADAEAAAAGVRALESDLNGLQRQSDVAGEAEVRLRELERQAEANRGLYESFLTRFKREDQQERMQRANARVVSQADIPTSPSYPRKLSLLMAVGMVALIGGAILVFLLDRLDNALRSADETEELTGLPTLAMVPYRRGRDVSPVKEILERPRSVLADAVRSLRTSLEIAGGEQAPVIMITSSVPKEGKTFLSFCLGLIYSKMGGRVLLIDADVYRPRLHTLTGTDGERGLAQALLGEAQIGDLIQHNVAGTLDFLPAGRAPDLPELLKGAAIEEMLKDLLTRYDRIIIDSPPVLAVADTRVLARLANRVIYLVRWNSTPRDAVRNGMKLLTGVGAPVHGVVLSQVDQRKHARYGYGDYGQYYGRYRDYYAE